MLVRAFGIFFAPEDFLPAAAQPKNALFISHLFTYKYAIEIRVSPLDNTPVNGLSLKKQTVFINFFLAMLLFQKTMSILIRGFIEKHFLIAFTCKALCDTLTFSS
jgi:hypothetical protein